ncbi:MAG: hypothetical protein JWP72_2248 [Massilia sp.]|nr:hypothetical protein [Massilia sp.]MDB5792602.1 hypothetical protein [Massilia sp.]
MMRIRSILRALLVAGLASGGMALAALPAPTLTPAQQQAAAAKKAAADAQAEQAKAQLAAAQDALSARWRSRASAQGWTARPPVAIAAAPASGAGVPAAGTPAPNAANAAPVVPASGAVPAAVQTTGVAVTGRPMPGVSPAATGVSANTITGTPAGITASSPGGGAAPRSPQALQSANVPIKSEKLGTAAPSPDVKKEQTRSVRAGASPAVDKGSAKEKQNQ